MFQDSVRCAFTTGYWYVFSCALTVPLWLHFPHCKFSTQNQQCLNSEIYHIWCIFILSTRRVMACSRSRAECCISIEIMHHTFFSLVQCCLGGGAPCARCSREISMVIRIWYASELFERKEIFCYLHIGIWCIVHLESHEFSMAYAD